MYTFTASSSLDYETDQERESDKFHVTVDSEFAAYYLKSLIEKDGGFVGEIGIEQPTRGIV